MQDGAYICDSISAVTSILQEFAQNKRSEAITNVYMIPQIFITKRDNYLQYEGDSVPKSYGFNVGKPNAVSRLYT